MPCRRLVTNSVVEVFSRSLFFSIFSQAAWLYKLLFDGTFSLFSLFEMSKFVSPLLSERGLATLLLVEMRVESKSFLLAASWLTARVPTRNLETFLLSLRRDSIFLRSFGKEPNAKWMLTLTEKNSALITFRGFEKIRWIRFFVVFSQQTAYIDRLESSAINSCYNPKRDNIFSKAIKIFSTYESILKIVLYLYINAYYYRFRRFLKNRIKNLALNAI